ncbi:MAG: hypothetical protein ACLSS9_09860 [Acutalibacteraceae bacterium]
MWYPNGFIITKQSYDKYMGVDNEAWPLEFEKIDNTKINSIHTKLAEDCYRHYKDPYVSLLSNIELVLYYNKICKGLGIQTNLLYCETRIIEPKFNIELLKQYSLESQFIGYDLAGKMPDYHSCIKNELLHNSFLFKKVTPKNLNSYGLFNRCSDVDSFIFERNDIQQKSTNIYLERDEFIIYKLFLVNPL